MMKRITAALLALILIISVLPVGAFGQEESEKIYQLGEEIWIVGASAKPTEKTAIGTKWDQYLTEDGEWESKQGECPLELHSHGILCYNTDGDLVCVKEVHKKHSVSCTIKYAKYHWIVVVDPSYIPPEEEKPDDNENQGQGPGYSDPNKEYPPGSANFTLRNIDPSGNTLQDIEYYLLNENNDVKGHFLTNPDGEIFFGGLQLKAGSAAETWTLVQNPPLPAALEEYYEHNQGKWNVTVVRNGDSDTFFVSNITGGEGTEDADPLQGYDAATNVMTVVNQPKLYDILVTLHPEGLENQGIPKDLIAHVTITGPDGEQISVDLPDGINPQSCLEGRKPGTYQVTGLTVENGEIDGYSLGQPYVVVALPRPSQDAEIPILQQDYVYVGSECAWPDFRIVLPYTKEDEQPSEPEQDLDLSNKILIQIVNEAGDPTDGAEVALMSGGDILERYTGETSYTLDLTSYPHGTYSLVQIKAPQGHEDAPERYSITVGTDRNGDPQVLLQKDSRDSGVVVNPGTGDQIAFFTNARKTTQVRLTCNVNVTFADGAWVDQSFVEFCRSGNNFRLIWTDSTGLHSEDLVVPHGETKGFEMPVPYGVDYRVEAMVADGAAFQESQMISGTVTLEDLETPIHIDAKGDYTVEPGVSQPLTMLMVDADDTAKTLPGVEFMLQWPDVEETISHVTDDGGRLLIRGNYTEPGSFQLTQVQAPDGYLPLGDPIQVNVAAAYAVKDSADPYVMVQNFIPTASHKDVEKQENGVYFIKNTIKEVGKPVEGEHSNVLLINVVTESGSPVDGTQITMTCPDGSKKTLKNGDIVDLEELGMTGTYNLVQTKSVTGHNIATETYAVTVTEKNGKLKVKAENTNLGLLDKIFGKNEIPFGPDSEWLLTFVNVRMTATLRLTCEVQVSFTGGSWHDMEFEKKYKEETEYQFLLSWDDGYAREQGEAMLVHGESEIFDLQVPYGVQYEIVCVNEKGYFDTTFHNAKTTEVDTTALKEGMQITATNTYIIEPNPDADPLEMHLVKVDATTKKPLEGVEFELQDADGRKLAGYTTDAEGKVDILNTLKIGGSYGLKETKALKGYEKPSAAYPIKVDAEYKLFTASGKPVLKQSFAAKMSSKAVEKQEDGSYLVKNYKQGQTPKDSGSKDGNNPKTADSFRIMAWSGALVISGMSLALFAVGMSKKRKIRS